MALVYDVFINRSVNKTRKTSGYATMVHGRGAIRITLRQLSQSWKLRHYDAIDDVITRKISDREKRRPHRIMKSSELANGENRIALRQLLQNRKWRHNFRSRWKLQKMAWENFSIGALYNITKNQDNPIKTVGRDSFLSPKTPKNTTFLGVTQPPGVTQPLYSRGHN